VTILSWINTSINPYVLKLTFLYTVADKREFIKISQAVGMGFLIMVGSTHIQDN